VSLDLLHVSFHQKASHFNWREPHRRARASSEVAWFQPPELTRAQGRQAMSEGNYAEEKSSQSGSVRQQPPRAGQVSQPVRDQCSSSRDSKCAGGRKERHGLLFDQPKSVLLLCARTVKLFQEQGDGIWTLR
jgi:hypothetical protein